MNHAGYVYVLINASMDGFVKVGKTTKSPEERAKELSTPTGVATPFVVAFDIFTEDCDNAEKYLHGVLEEKGYRLSANKEFFKAPLSEVIKIFIDAKPRLEAANLTDENVQQGDVIEDGISEAKDIMLAQANEYYYGLNDNLQDYVEALKLYKQAARLGSLDAFNQLAEMYVYGKGCQADYRLAMEYLKEGAKRGSLECNCMMAMIFGGGIPEFQDASYININNAKKCWRRYFSMVNSDRITESESNLISLRLSLYLQLFNGSPNDVQDNDVLFAFTMRILSNVAKDQSLLSNTVTEKWCLLFALDVCKRTTDALKESLLSHFDFTDLYFQLGSALVGVGQNEEAIGVLRNVIGVQPDHPEAHYELGLAYGKVGKYADAIDELDRAIKLNPDFSDAHDTLGIAYARSGNHEKAIECFKSAIGISPSQARVHTNLVASYLALLRYGDTITACLEALKYHPMDAIIYHSLGSAYSNNGQLLEAQEAFETAIRINPEYASAHYNLGVVFEELRHYGAALKAYKVAAGLKPDDPIFQNNLGVAYWNLRQPSEAIESYKKAISLKYNFAKPHYNVGEAYLAIGKRELALHEYDVLKLLDPKIARLLNELLQK